METKWFVKVNQSDMQHNARELFYVVVRVNSEGRLVGLVEASDYPWAWGFERSEVKADDGAPKVDRKRRECEARMLEIVSSPKRKTDACKAFKGRYESALRLFGDLLADGRIVEDDDGLFVAANEDGGEC